jgi:hypothetical protein
MRYVARQTFKGDHRMAFNLASTPFSSTSAFNQQVNTGATYTQINWSTGGGVYEATWANTGFPVYVASSSDPVVQVSVPASWGWPGGTVSIHVPAGATGAPTSSPNPDAPLIVIEPDGTVYNFWRFNRTSDTTATAQSYGEANVATGTGWGSSNGTGAGTTAVGSNYLGGLLVQAQTDTGTINHALELAVANNLLAPGYVSPAISSDGYTVGAPLQEGQHLAIPPGTPMPSGLSPLGQEVFRALQQYGAYITDRGGGETALRAQFNAYNATTISALDTDLNKLIPMLEKVSGGSPTSSGSTSSSGTTSGGTTVTHAPTVAITSAGGTVTSASQTIGGTVDAADAGSTVKVLDGTTQIGTAPVGANGAWSASVTLPNQGANVITVTDANAAGTGTSSAVTYTLDPPAAQVTAAPTVTIASAGGTVTSASQTIAGTVDAADASSTVKVLDGTTQIGTARVGANGAWSASVTLPNQGANVITAIDANAGGTGTSSAVTYTLDPPAPVAPELTVPGHPLSVSPGGSVSLGIGVSVPHAGDNVSVTISGLPGYETITDKADGKTFSGSSVALTAAEVNSGLTLNNSYHGHGRPSATLTVTAHDATGTPMTSALQTITVKDPPATTSTSTTTTGSGTSTTTSGSSSGDGQHHWSGHRQNSVTASSAGTSTTTSGRSWGLSHRSDGNVAQWFSNHPDFARAATTLSEVGASRWGAAHNGATTSTDATGSAGARAYALLNQMMAGDCVGHLHFASTATASSTSSQQQANLLTRPLH